MFTTNDITRLIGVKCRLISCNKHERHTVHMTDRVCNLHCVHEILPKFAYYIIIISSRCGTILDCTVFVLYMFVSLY